MHLALPRRLYVVSVHPPYRCPRVSERVAASALERPQAGRRYVRFCSMQRPAPSAHRSSRLRKLSSRAVGCLKSLTGDGRPRFVQGDCSPRVSRLPILPASVLSPYGHPSARLGITSPQDRSSAVTFTPGCRTGPSPHAEPYRTHAFIVSASLRFGASSVPPVRFPSGCEGRLFSSPPHDSNAQAGDLSPAPAIVRVPLRAISCFASRRTGLFSRPTPSS